MKQNFTNPILGRWIWTAVAIIILATFGHLALKYQQGPNPAIRITSVPTPQTDWRGVDRAVVTALTAAHTSAETTASTRLDSWIRCLMQRADSDFLPWYFGYWNQQALGLKTVCYWAAHELGFSQQAAGERITCEIQKQFARRVLRPEIAQLELETIARESLQAYVNELGPRLAAIPASITSRSPNGIVTSMTLRFSPRAPRATARSASHSKPSRHPASSAACYWSGLSARIWNPLQPAYQQPWQKTWRRRESPCERRARRWVRFSGSSSSRGMWPITSRPNAGNCRFSARASPTPWHK